MSKTTPAATPPAAPGAEKTADQAAKQLTAKEAAAQVKRPVLVKDGDKLVEKLVAVRAEEVLAFKDYGTHVVVVTVDGKKFSSAEAEA